MKRIRYNHTSSETADSYDEALGQICGQALAIAGGEWNPVSARENLVIIDTPDGDFVYLNQDDADNDDTGASAFAVIVSDEKGTVYRTPNPEPQPFSS